MSSEELNAARENINDSFVLAKADEPPIKRPGATLPDPGRSADIVHGGRHADTLISDAGNDTLIGKFGVDTYVINHTNHDRVVNIIDKGINWLAIEGGTRMMKLDIRKDAVLLDDKPLEIEEKSPNGTNIFIHRIDNLVLLITPNYDINTKIDAQKTGAVKPPNPLLQMMSNLPLVSKLTVLNHINQQMQQPEAVLNKEAANQFG